MTAASFTASLDTGGNAVTADQLSNHFSVTPGPDAEGDVDGLAIDLGLMDEPQTVSGVFTVRNVSSTTKTATLSFVGPQVATATFATVGLGKRHPRSRRVELGLADHVGGDRGRGRRHAAPEARGLDVALPRLLRRVRGGSRRAGVADGHPEAGRRHRALLAGLRDHDEPRRLRRLPLDRRQLVEADRVAGHGRRPGWTRPRRTGRSTPTGCARSPPAACRASTAPTATARADSSAPTRPSAVALANGGGTGAAYLNAANSGSVSIARHAGARARSPPTS